MPYGAPAWADDVTFMFVDSDPHRLVTALQEAARIVHKRIQRLGVELNLQSGKTEVVLQLRGKGTAALRRQLLVQCNAWLDFESFEGQQLQVHITEQYRHLGGCVVAKDTVLPEIKSRASQASQALAPLLSHVFSNPSLPLRSKRQVFVQLIQSRLLHHAAVWTFQTQQERQAFHGACMLLLRKVHRRTHRFRLHATSDDTVVNDLQTLWPGEMLSIERLRHYGVILQFGPSLLWALLRQEQSWLAQIKLDVQWAVRTLPFNSLRSSLAQNDWGAVDQQIREHPHAWKTFLRRVIAHLQRHRGRLSHAGQWESRMQDGFLAAGSVILHASRAAASEATTDADVQCSLCGKIFNTAAKLSVHKHKQHKAMSEVYGYARGTSCLVCLKEYHSTNRLREHLRKTQDCLVRLRESEVAFPELQEDVSTGWFAFKPVIKLAGPSPWWATLKPVASLFDVPGSLPDPIEKLVCRLKQFLPNEPPIGKPFVGFVPQAIAALRAHSGSTPAAQKALPAHTLAALDQLATTHDICFCERVLSAATWVLLAEDEVCHSSKHAWQAARCESNVCVTDLAFLSLQRLAIQPASPKFVLHLFSGCSKVTNMHVLLTKLADAGQRPVTCISIDVETLVLDRQKCFALLALIKRQAFLAAIAEPSAQTWSSDGVGHRLDEEAQSPARPMRSSQDPWGFVSLSWKQSLRVCKDSFLLQFMLEVMLACYAQDVSCLLAHPKAPDCTWAPSMWRLPLVRFLLTLPGVGLAEITQDWFEGQATAQALFMHYGFEQIIDNLGSPVNVASEAVQRLLVDPLESRSAASVFVRHPGFLDFAISEAIIARCARLTASLDGSSEGSLQPEDLDFLASLHPDRNPCIEADEQGRDLAWEQALQDSTHNAQ